jgi:acetate kinase
VVEALERLVAMAPLHQPPAVAALRAARARFGEVPHVACFDTAFHATLPEAEWRYPVPYDWVDDLGVRRYGFHGLSVAWAVRRAAELLDRPIEGLCLVVAHLGGGCSVTAVDGGRSVRTSMGYTPLEGLMMTTRSGSIDPGLMLRLLSDGRVSVADLSDALEHRSGLLGVSGVSADLREVQAAADAGDARAALAIEMFVARASAAIGAAAVALPRLDGVVFTGGIGEHADRVRAATVTRLGVLGMRPIPADVPPGDRILTDREDGPAVLRVEAREDLVMALETASLLG